MKTSFIKFRCTIYEKKLIKILAKKAGLSLSEFCRKSAFDKEIIERLNEDQILYYKTLVKYHNNFKSIGNMYKNKDPKLTFKVNELADEIKTIITNF